MNSSTFSSNFTWLPLNELQKNKKSRCRDKKECKKNHRHEYLTWVQFIILFLFSSATLFAFVLPARMSGKLQKPLKIRKIMRFSTIGSSVSIFYSLSYSTSLALHSSTPRSRPFLSSPLRSSQAAFHWVVFFMTSTFSSSIVVALLIPVKLCRTFSFYFHSNRCRRQASQTGRSLSHFQPAFSSNNYSTLSAESYCWLSAGSSLNCRQRWV